MHGPISPESFAARMVGVPWRRWRSDFEAVDCFGLIVLYFREVLGISLGDVPETDIATGFAAARGWEQCDRAEPGAVGFMTWRHGAPTHCGIVLPGGRLLHAQEGHPISDSGSVRISRLVVMQRACADLRFYRYAPTC